MKISKLFHWLYAIVMLLPIGYIGGFTLYSVFNKNAYLSNSITETSPQVEIEYQYTYQTNEVNSVNDLVGGYIYHIDNFVIDFSGEEEGFYDFVFFIANIDSLSFLDYNVIVEEIFVDNVNNNYLPYLNCVGFGIYYDSGDIYTSYWSYTCVGNQFVYCGGFVDGGDAEINFSGDFIIRSDTLTSFKQYCTDFNYLPSASDYLGSIVSATGTVIPGEPGTLDNAFNYALENLNNLPFFAWSQNTFFSAPFNYIANLFGIASSNPICSLLSYWFSISVIWLVFDVMLYVPLLVHRWLDKASIE